MSERRRVLVTGGSGFIGTHFVARQLRREDTLVLNLDIAEPTDAEHSPCWRQVDVTDAPGVEAAVRGFEPTHVVHLAAETDALPGMTLQEFPRT